MRELIVKYWSGKISSKERKQLANWLLNKENRIKYRNLKELWSHMQAYKQDFIPDKNEAWIKFDSRIQKAKSRRLFIRYSTAVAASILFFFAGWNLLFEENSQQIEIFAENGQNKNIVLPDSSRIYLKNGSSISYLAAFEKRKVKLNGEAFFEITRNPKSPFKVLGEKTEVTVLGTSFNYKTGAKSSSEIIHVFSGKVSFQNTNKQNEKLLLTKGKMASLENNKLEDNEFSNSNILFYKTGKLVFDNTELQEFIDCISDAYQQRIELGDSSLLNIRINTEFDNASMEEILEEIELTANVKFTKENDTWILNKAY